MPYFKNIPDVITTMHEKQMQALVDTAEAYSCHRICQLKPFYSSAVQRKITSGFKESVMDGSNFFVDQFVHFWSSMCLPGQVVSVDTYDIIS